MPRIPVFQRPGGSPAPVAASSGADDPQQPGPDDASESRNMVTCPECGCQFDPAEGQAQAGPAPDAASGDSGGGGDLGAKIAAMMGAGGGAPS